MDTVPQTFRPYDAPPPPFLRGGGDAVALRRPREHPDTHERPTLRPVVVVEQPVSGDGTDRTHRCGQSIRGILRGIFAGQPLDARGHAELPVRTASQSECDDAQIELGLRRGGDLEPLPGLSVEVGVVAAGSRSERTSQQPTTNQRIGV